MITDGLRDIAFFRVTFTTNILTSYEVVYCQARVLVLVIVLDYSLRLVSIPVSKGPELKL